jgi:hypothetical protein
MNFDSNLNSNDSFFNNSNSVHRNDNEQPRPASKRTRPSVNSTAAAAAEKKKLELLMRPTNHILVNSRERIMPLRQIKKTLINEAIHDYLRLTGKSELSEFDWFVWPAILRGDNLFAMPDNKDSTHLRQSTMYFQDKAALLAESSFNSMSYLYPLLSLILNQIENENKMRMEGQGGAAAAVEKSKGYIKKSLCMQAQNGPVLIIVCASCSRGN